MKSIAITLAFLLACILVVPNHAQSKKKAAKVKAAKPITPDIRTVSASPVIEGDPITKPDNRVVSASPVIEGDPMVPDDRVTIQDLKTKLAASAPVLILDVRATEGWNSSPTKIKGAIRVPYEDIEKRMMDWKKTQEIIAYCTCSDDATSLSVARTLKKAGFKNVKALWGGWSAWEQAGYATEPK